MEANEKRDMLVELACEAAATLPPYGTDVDLKEYRRRIAADAVSGALKLESTGSVKLMKIAGSAAVNAFSLAPSSEPFDLDQRSAAAKAAAEGVLIARGIALESLG